MRKIAYILTVFTLIASLAMPVSADWTETDEERLVWGIDGINMINHTSSGNQKIKILKIDLSNPRLKIKLLFDKRGVSYLSNVKNLASADERVIAAINADFFGWYSKDRSRGSAAGLNMAEGELLSSPPVEEELASFVFTESGGVLSQYFKPAISVITEEDEVYKVNAVNKYDSLTNLAIYTSAWGKTLYIEGGTQFAAVVEDDEIVEITNEEGDIAIPENGYIVTGLSDITDFFTVIEEGDALTADISFTPYFGDIETAVGGGSVLVKNGYAAEITHMRYGRDYRSAAGISKDGKILYLIAADKGGGSIGVSLSELSSLMIKLGIYDGINFDGGGSTQLVARADGDEALSYVNSPENGYLRPVINALGVAVTGGERGVPDGITVKTDVSSAVVGEKITAKAVVFDQLYYGMETPKGAEFDFSFEGVEGTREGNSFTPGEAGTLTVSVTWEDFSAYKTVKVTDPYKYVDADALIYRAEVGETVKIGINGITLTGKQEKADISKAVITVDGDFAEVKGSQVIAKKPGFGVINFTYGKFSFSAYLSVGGVMPADMLCMAALPEDELAGESFTPSASITAGITPTDTLIYTAAVNVMGKRLKDVKLSYSFDGNSGCNGGGEAKGVTLICAESSSSLPDNLSCNTPVLALAVDDFNSGDTIKLANALSYNVADGKDVFVVYEGAELTVENYGGVRFISLPPLAPSILTNQKTALVLDIGVKNGRAVYEVSKFKIFN